MLEVNVESKTYKMKNENFKALDNVKFKIEDNGLICVLGPSGSGKTTLMNIVGALDSDFEGDVVINNKSIKEFKSKDLDSYRKNTIGFIFQQFYLVNKFSAYDNIKVALDLANEQDKKQKIMDLLKEVEMESFAKRKVNVLSGGQKQRIAIARALANDPDIILADEPTGALDSKMSIEVMELLKKLSKNKLVLVITHSQEIVDKYADKVIKMEDGKITEISDVENSQESKVDKVVLNDRSSKQNKKSNMSYLKAFMYTLKNIGSRKARTIATAIGMSIGIVGIGLALAMSNGTMQIAKAQIESVMPTNMVTVTHKGEEPTGVISMTNGIDESKLFKQADFEYIKGLSENIKNFWLVPVNAYEKFFTEVTLNKDDIETPQMEISSFMLATSIELYENVDGNLTLGRAPSNKNEIVISLNTADYFMKANETLKLEDLIGKKLYIKFGPMTSMGRRDPQNKAIEFDIVGITSINTMGHSIYQNAEDTLNLFAELYETNREDMKYIESYMYLDKDLKASEIESTIKELNEKQDRFKFTGSAGSLISDVQTVLDVVQNVLIGFSSISVLVAILMIGIVIYISVIERISEIGILRAIGAKRKDIRNIFISEAVIIGLLSGIIGVLVTKGLCIAIDEIVANILTQYGMSIGHINIAILTNIAAFSLIAVCVILSMIAGIIPSQKAAKLDPIVALRRD